MLKERNPNAIGVICGEGPLAVPRGPPCMTQHHTQGQPEGREVDIRCNANDTGSCDKAVVPTELKAIRTSYT